MEKITILEEGGKTYLLIPVPENYAYGFISKSGKSFSYRTKTREGENDKYSTYLSKRLPIDSSYGDHFQLSKAIDAVVDGKVIKAWKERVVR